jgi:hypothetical protein
MILHIKEIRKKWVKVLLYLSIARQIFGFRMTWVKVFFTIEVKLGFRRHVGRKEGLFHLR